MKRFYSVFLIVTSLLVGGAQAGARIEFVEFKDAEIRDAARILSSMTGANIAVTKEASSEKVTLLLQKTELKHAVEMLSRVAGLWYRYSKLGNSYIIMTEKQYQDDIVVYRDDVIRTFTLRHQNVSTTAVTIQSLFGDRVRLSLQQGNDDFQGLDLEVGDTNEATTINNDSDDSDEIKIQELDREEFDRTDEDQVAEKSLSKGALRQLGGAEEVSEDSANKLLGAKTPIYIATNKIHNLLHVRTSDENALAEIARLIKESDKPTPQVLLEMKIVKIDVGEGYEQDFDLSFNDALNVTGNYQALESQSPSSLDLSNAQYQTSGVGINELTNTFSQLLGKKSTGFGFNDVDGGFYEFFSNYVTAKVAFLEQNNQAEVVAKPVMLASNNRPARLFIGSEQVVPVNLETDTEFSAANNNGDRTSSTTTTLETERRKIGNTLILLPSVNADRTVTIDIFQDTSSIERNGMNFPFFNSETNRIETIPLDAVQESNVKTVVVAKDGKTIALGGMITSEQSDYETVVPLLGQVPIIGEMFRSKEERDEKSQYVMLITPHVLMNPEESEDQSRKVKEFAYEVDVQSFSQNTKQYSVTDFIRLTRYAAQIGRGNDADKPKGLVDVPVTLSPLSLVFSDPSLSVWPVGSWQQNGLHITLLKARNHLDKSRVVDLTELPGNWLASAAGQERLAAFGRNGDEGDLYLLSNKPFNQVVSAVNNGVDR
ncbi:hypothetical protein ACMXYV_13725 [Neptuniibacter sp. SY11_33]|uniref:DUF3438 family protein n=1 Tax=Neptuniibacter sp. SY11_33 TaxID=3398215 RepID=UPI0039F4F677